jgi:hypothetical protein
MGGSPGASAGRRMLAGPDSRDREVTPVGDVRGDGPAGVLIDWRLPLLMILAKVSLSDTFAKIMTSAGRAPELRLAAGGWRLAAASMINRPSASTDDEIRLLIMKEVR